MAPRQGWGSSWPEPIPTREILKEPGAAENFSTMWILTAVTWLWMLLRWFFLLSFTSVTKSFRKMNRKIF